MKPASPPLRSFLFAPGNHARRVANALSLNADAIILDLEDAVATAEKPAARGAVAAALALPRQALLYVRVNAADTEFCYRDLVAVVRPGLDGIVLPKVQSATALATMDWLLAQLEHEQGLGPRAIDLIPIIETADGLTNLDVILAAGTRVRHVAFGAGDFTLDVNMAWSRTEAELGFARARIATASRAAGIEAPLDTVWVDLADEEGLEMSARTARGFGFQGKMCIHPRQIAPVHRVFTPGEAEVAFAERVVAAFAEAEAAGSAAIQLDGKFIDYPILYRAQRVLGKDGGHPYQGRSAMTGAAGLLGGVTVLDLCSYLAGPYGCTLLADLGASVIKIESPQGDMLRQFPSSLASESRFFVGTNRGKRALAIDLKQPEGLAVLHRLVETADVLVENFRPSVPARLGIDYPRLKSINPRLVYCGLTGYGDSGPLSEKGGFDQVLQCLSGIAVFQGAAAGTPQVVLGSVLDYFTSALLAYGVAAALYYRERSGQGQYLSLSLLRSALTIQAGRFVWAESEGRDVARDSGAGGLTGIHPTKDGWLYVSVHSNHFFAALCGLIGRPELADDPRCATMRSRAAHAAELVPELRSALAARTALEWEKLFGERVPCAAVRPIEDMFDHPQVLGEDLVATLDHPVVGRYRAMKEPIKFSGTPGPAPTPAPTLGQHSDEILTGCGYSAEEIAALRQRGVVL